MIIKFTRVCFDFSKDALKRLKDLTKKVDSTSYAETIRQALTAYEHKIYMEDKGYEYMVIRDGEKPCFVCKTCVLCNKRGLIL
jgi:hypothetical protein